jgi:hypothetical protein
MTVTVMLNAVTPLVSLVVACFAHTVSPTDSFKTTQVNPTWFFFCLEEQAGFYQSLPWQTVLIWLSFALFNAF